MTLKDLRKIVEALGGLDDETPVNIDVDLDDTGKDTTYDVNVNWVNVEIDRGQGDYTGKYINVNIEMTSI